ncbi:MAG: thioredoxin domain-containing protein [Bdellovibrionales bacterium]|nr:thioredoxin domain-containing protein [Bdellovibrionales bacterium]
MNESKLSKKDRENILNNMKLQKSKTSNKTELEKVMTTDVKWLLPPPLPKAVLSTGSSPRLGSFFAPVKLIVASNYHCPFCPQAETRLTELRTKYGEKLRIHYRFSMREPDNSIVRSAAEATMCADDQGKFWEYRDNLAKAPGTDVARYAEVAKEVGLNVEKWQKCLTDRKHKADIENDIRDTTAAGIETAPMFVINGKAIAGQSSLSDLEAVVEHELQ